MALVALGGDLVLLRRLDTLTTRQVYTVLSYTVGCLLASYKLPTYTSRRTEQYMIISCSRFFSIDQLVINYCHPFFLDNIDDNNNNNCCKSYMGK